MEQRDTFGGGCMHKYSFIICKKVAGNNVCVLNPFCLSAAFCFHIFLKATVSRVSIITSHQCVATKMWKTVKQKTHPCTKLCILCIVHSCFCHGLLQLLPFRSNKNVLLRDKNPCHKQLQMNAFYGWWIQSAQHRQITQMASVNICLPHKALRTLHEDNVKWPSYTRNNWWEKHKRIASAGCTRTASTMCCRYSIVKRVNILTPRYRKQKLVCEPCESHVGEPAWLLCIWIWMRDLYGLHKVIFIFLTSWCVYAHYFCDIYPMHKGHSIEPWIIIWVPYFTLGYTCTCNWTTKTAIRSCWDIDTERRQDACTKIENI